MFFARVQIMLSKCKYTHAITAVARKQRLSDNQSWLLGETVWVYLQLHTCDHVKMYTYA